MNRSGRLEDGIPAEQHIRILSVVSDDLSCLFVHLRDCPLLFARASSLGTFS
jgi:hypothetical protein